MSIADRFIRDEDNPEWLLWSTERPFFNDAQVKFFIREDGECYPQEDEPAYGFEVTAEVEEGGELSRLQEACWSFIVENAQAVERDLRRKLWAICSENFGYFLEEVEEDNPDWEEMQGELDWKDPEALDAQICLTGITLHGVSLDGAGLCSFDFEVGWDEDHGQSVLMVKDRVIVAVGGSTLSNRGDSLLAHAKGAQEIGFTEGDLRL